MLHNGGTPRARCQRALGLAARLLLVPALAVALASWHVQPAHAADTKIAVGTYWFCDSSYQSGVCVTNVEVGDTVTWNFPGGIYALDHTTTECGGDSCDDPAPPMPVWDSGLQRGSSYQFTFTQPGTYLYQCGVHGSLMRGQIVVAGQAVGGIAELPAGAPLTFDVDGVSGPGRGLMIAFAAAAASALALAVAAVWYALRRAP